MKEKEEEIANEIIPETADVVATPKPRKPRVNKAAEVVEPAIETPVTEGIQENEEVVITEETIFLIEEKPKKNKKKKNKKLKEKEKAKKTKAKAKAKKAKKAKKDKAKKAKLKAKAKEKKAKAKAIKAKKNKKNKGKKK